MIQHSDRNKSETWFLALFYGFASLFIVRKRDKKMANGLPKEDALIYP